MRLAIRVLGLDLLDIEISTDEPQQDDQMRDLSRRHDQRLPDRLHAEPGRPAVGARCGPVTIVTDRVCILDKLADANERAKAIARRGYSGTASDDYRDAHSHIDWLLTRLGY